MGMDSSRVSLFVLMFSFCFHGSYTQADEMFSEQMGVRITSIGATETIRCSKSNQGDNLVVWQHKGEDVSVNGLIFTSNQDHRKRYTVKGDDDNGNYNLQIEDIRPEDTGSWECLYGPAGNVHNVLKSVMIVTPPDDGFPTCGVTPSTAIRVGDPFQLTCTSSGGFPSPTIVWLRDGVELSRTSVDDSLVLSRTAEQADYNVQYSCELQSLALTTSGKCTRNIMVAPTEAPTARVTTRLVSTPELNPRVTSTTPNVVTQQPNIPPEQRTTMTYRPTNAVNPGEPAVTQSGVTTSNSISSNDHASVRPRVTNARENAGQTDSVNQEAASPEYMFDALAIFGLMCGVFLVILILMAVSYTKARNKAYVAEKEKIRGSTETLTEQDSTWIRPYSTVTINSAATTETVYDIPRLPSVYRTSFMDMKTGRVVSSTEICDPDRIYQQDVSSHYYSNVPFYSEVKK